MARRKAKQRREPVFDAHPVPGMDVRPDPRDRPGGPPAKPTARRRTPAESEKRSRNGRAEAATPQKTERKGGSGGGGKRRTLLGRLVYWSFVLALWGFIALIGVFAWVFMHLPPIQSLEVPKRPPSVRILALDGQPLATRGDMGGASVALKSLPPYLPQAFLAIEDRRFYSHYGIDPVGVARAVLANLLHRGVAQGGSTLTQQLAKNLFLTQERSFDRKIQELVLALWLEHKFSKAEILDLYLNRVYFGSGAYGVEAAAQRYFGKPARMVTLSEAALLAGLVKSPSRLAPNRNPDGAERRAQVVLAAMVEAGYVSPGSAKVAIAHPPHIVTQTGAGSGNYVADWVMDVLDDVIGRVEQDIVVETTIDPSAQAAAEKALTEELAKRGQKLGVSQGALVALTPDGAVRALVGGRNYADSQFNRAVAARRQPGSAFKPFVFLAALERGLTPDTIREDRPISVKGWRPENYKREYFGPVTLTRALAQSLNTVSVRLILETGPKAVVRTAQRLGIASKLASNASLALGTSEVSPLELTAAYAPFANGGLAVTPQIIARVRSADGRILFQAPPPGRGRVIDERYVAMMNSMMRETLVSGTARKGGIPGWQAAGKTGTSQDFRDAWFVGYTAHLIAGVWLGNDDNSPTRHVTGGGLPVEIWSRFMRATHQGVPVADLPGGRPGFLPALPAPSVAAAPSPPATVERRPAPAAASLDRWLVDRLLGR